MDFGRWLKNQKPFESPVETKKVKQLTEEAQFDRDEFERGSEDYGGISLANRGCICFTGCAPCSFCTHPGNPFNQDVDDCWEEVDE